jgi:hypothetical protein
VKLEAENGELGVARELLGRARTVADTERVHTTLFDRDSCTEFNHPDMDGTDHI